LNITKILSSLKAVTECFQGKDRSGAKVLILPVFLTEQEKAAEKDILRDDLLSPSVNETCKELFGLDDAGCLLKPLIQ
jgi:hypothetical protein